MGSFSQVISCQSASGAERVKTRRLWLLFDLLAGGYAGSKIMNDKGPRYAAKDYSVSGAAWLWIKDLQAYLSEAKATGTPTLIGDRQLDAFQGLTDAGLGQQDTAVIQKWIADRSTAS